MTDGLKDVQLHFIDSVDDAAEFMRWLGERHEVIAVDTETTGLDPMREHVRLIQVGDAMHGWAMPWNLWGGVALEALNKYDGQIVMHNAKFDTHFIDRDMAHVIPRHRIDDTMVMAHILDPTYSVALKSLTSRFIDRRAADAQQVLDQMMVNNGWTWATVPVDLKEYWGYGALDTVLTARLWAILKPRVMAEAPKAYDLEMAATWVIQGMERKGCKVDIDYTAAKLKDFTTYVDQAGRWCESEYGIKPGTNSAVIAALEADGIVVPVKYTNGGARSLDKEVLEGVIATTGHPLAQTVLQRRRLQKLASTYLANFIKLADADGYLHPNVKVLGARTSRTSVTEPALQTLPRRSEANQAAITVRNCITASDLCTLILCDFDQIEMRMFAHFAEDPALIAAFLEGDFFCNVATELYAQEVLKGNPLRQYTKNGMYALGYGAGAEKIALTTGRELTAVLEFLKLLEVRYPGIKRLQRAVQQAALHRKATEGVPYVLSPLTNRKHVADEGKEYALVNYLIQGTAAEVFKMKLVEAANAGLDEYMILGVHDEIILDVPLDVADDVEQTVQAVMTDRELFKVPLTAGVDRAARWGEKAA